MKQHVLAFAAALVVWVVGNLVVAVVAQEGGSGIRVNLATSMPTPQQRIITTDDARCVQSDTCWAWYLFSCNGHLPNCNGGCWITGYYPCSACVESPGETCVQERVSLNAGLYRSDCTSNNGYNCNTCLGNWVYLYPYTVTTLRCR